MKIIRNKTVKMVLGNLILLLGLTMGLRGAFGADPDITPNTIELLSYQSSGYRYNVIALNGIPPQGFEQQNFDDTELPWLEGIAAFGSGGSCPVQLNVKTFWVLNSQLLVRKVLSIPSGATDVRIMVSIDNDIVGIYFNGEPISDFVSHDNCPYLDEFRFDVPPALVQEGENLVVFHILDRGGQSFFDTRILAEIPPNITVDIDVKPCSFPNSVNPRSQGKIPVAILSGSYFDATTVNPFSVNFGVTGTEAYPVHFALEDVDNDGDIDMIFHFNTQDTGIKCGDTSYSITGETINGQLIEGIDSIKTVGCK